VVLFTRIKNRTLIFQGFEGIKYLKFVHNCQTREKIAIPKLSEENIIKESSYVEFFRRDNKGKIQKIKFL